MTSAASSLNNTGSAYEGFVSTYGASFQRVTEPPETEPKPLSDSFQVIPSDNTKEEELVKTSSATHIIGPATISSSAVSIKIDPTEKTNTVYENTPKTVETPSTSDSLVMPLRSSMEGSLDSSQWWVELRSLRAEVAYDKKMHANEITELKSDCAKEQKKLKKRKKENKILAKKINGLEISNLSLKQKLEKKEIAFNEVVLTFNERVLTLESQVEELNKRNFNLIITKQRLKKEKKDVLEKLSEKTREIDRLRDENLSLQQSVVALEGENVHIQRQLRGICFTPTDREKEMEVEIRTLMHQNQELGEDVLSLERKMHDFREENNKYNEKVNDLDNVKRELAVNSAELNSIKSKNRLEISKLQQELKHAKEDREHLQSKIQDFEEHEDRYKKKVDKLKKRKIELANCQEELEKQQKMREESVEICKKLEQEKSNNEMEISNLRHRLQSEKENKESLNKEIQALENQNLNLIAEIVDWKESNDGLNLIRTELREEIKNLSNAIDKNEMEISNLKHVLVHEQVGKTRLTKLIREFFGKLDENMSDDVEISILVQKAREKLHLKDNENLTKMLNKLRVFDLALIALEHNQLPKKLDPRVRNMVETLKGLEDRFKDHTITTQEDLLEALKALADRQKTTSISGKSLALGGGGFALGILTATSGPRLLPLFRQMQLRVQIQAIKLLKLVRG
jgi:chromosome segregation ATPase